MRKSIRSSEIFLNGFFVENLHLFLVIEFKFLNIKSKSELARVMNFEYPEYTKKIKIKIKSFYLIKAFNVTYLPLLLAPMLFNNDILL